MMVEIIGFFIVGIITCLVCHPGGGYSGGQIFAQVLSIIGGLICAILSYNGVISSAPVMVLGLLIAIPIFLLCLAIAYPLVGGAGVLFTDWEFVWFFIVYAFIFMIYQAFFPWPALVGLLK